MEPTAAAPVLADDAMRVDISSSSSGAVLEFGGTAPRAAAISPEELNEKAIAKVAAVKAKGAAAAAASAPAAAEDVPIRVCVRVRPTLEPEKAKIGREIPGNTDKSNAQVEYEAVVVPERGVVVTLSEARKLGNPTGEIAARKFVAHRAFAPDESNDAVYADAIAPLVACVQSGGAALALAYGQTSAGKTFTIEAVQSVAGTALLKSGPLRLSCFEICGEKCSDLLTPGAAVELCDDGTGAVVPRGLSEFSVATAAELEAKLAAARGARATHATRSNDVSSRSHAVCALGVGGAGGSGATWGAAGGLLLLVDLAGSERRADQNDVERLNEAKEINASLSALNECLRIRAIPPKKGDKPQHVPYRRSKLTMLLRPFLDDEPAAAAGDADAAAADRKALERKTCFIAHVAPLRSHGPLSVQTLEYAMQMIIATRAERERAGFSSIEKWPPKKVVEWCKELDDGKYAEVAHAFARCSGKQLSCEWVGDVQQWIEAAGGTADDGKYIYDAFHAMHLREKGKK